MRTLRRQKIMVHLPLTNVALARVTFTTIHHHTQANTVIHHHTLLSYIYTSPYATVHHHTSPVPIIITTPPHHPHLPPAFPILLLHPPHNNAAPDHRRKRITFSLLSRAVRTPPSPLLPTTYPASLPSYYYC